MHHIHTLFGWLEVTIDVTASIIMVLAFVVAVFSYFKITFRARQSSYFHDLQLLRCDLGLKLVFSLELLIISDLLHSSVSRSMDDLIIVAGLVGIRTVIGYFLNREIAQISTEHSGLHGDSNG